MRTILIVDDHPLFREGLRGLIEKVVGEAGTAREGFRMAEKLRPDIAIVDLRLPDMDGIGLTEKMRSRLKHTRVMLLSAYFDKHSVKEALRAGADGYMVKGSESRGILRCIEAVAEGRRFVDRELSGELCDAAVSDAPGKRVAAREEEIMRLIVEGLGPEEIAGRLGISYKTVTAHKANIMKKLGLGNDVELVRHAINTGLIDPDVWKYGTE